MKISAKAIFALGLIIALLLPTAVSAQTPTTEWVSFYSSNTTIGGQPVPAGSVIRAYDPDSVLCGTIVVSQAGSYGFLACTIDDPNTNEDEGIRPGDEVRFTIDGFDAGNFTVPSQIENGDRFEVNLASAGPDVIPEPATIALLGLGLAGMAGYVRRRRHSSPA